MPTDLDDQHADKISIIQDLFISTADDNYVAARWCFHNRLDVDFFWLVVHAVEKYLKAILLLNNKPAKNYNHNIVSLYDDAHALAPDLFLEKFSIPNRMPTELWMPESVDGFVRRLHENGRADNRYQLFGYSRQAADLWKADQLIFSIRRLCHTLDAYILGEEILGGPNYSVRESLTRNPKTWQLNLRLEEILSGKQSAALSDALLLWNFPFAPEGRNHPKTDYVFSSRTPVLERRLYGPLETGPEHFECNDRLWEWVQENIYLPKELKTEIEKERLKIKEKFAVSAPPSS